MSGAATLKDKKVSTLEKIPVPVGVIGIGSMGKNHARIYSEMPHVNLVGVVDIDRERGEQYARKLGTAYFEDYHELFGKVKAVNIAVPTSLHHRMALEFLEKEVHVLVEKPITHDLQEAKEIVEAAKSHDMVLQVGHLERFNPAVGHLKELVKKPLYLEAHRMGYPSGRNLDVGVVWDLMIHDLDILINFVHSSVIHINAFGLSLYSSQEDMALVQLLFKNGSIASLFASRISGEKIRHLKIIEQERTFLLDFMNQSLSVLRLPKENHTNPPEFIPIKRCEPLRSELEHFMDCVIRHKTPMVTGDDGKKALELAINVVNNMKIVKKRNSVIAKKLMEMAKAG
ncbi:MAG: Gfo/Idh/MocA family oxidoreductase [Candidatus Eremiobacteraeota bacterium]|nr:Gfo/Idh/MocA family oxidoreductase [Candidatus Eremiobacteraeota bacterium]